MSGRKKPVKAFCLLKTEIWIIPVMNTIRTGIGGVVVLEPEVFGDARRYFFESWNKVFCYRSGYPRGKPRGI